MNARPPYLQALPTNPDRLIADANQAAAVLARGLMRLAHSRDPAAAEALARQAAGIERVLLRARAALLAAQEGPHAA